MKISEYLSICDLTHEDYVDGIHLTQNQALAIESATRMVNDSVDLLSMTVYEGFISLTDIDRLRIKKQLGWILWSVSVFERVYNYRLFPKTTESSSSTQTTITSNAISTLHIVSMIVVSSNNVLKSVQRSSYKNCMYDVTVHTYLSEVLSYVRKLGGCYGFDYESLITSNAIHLQKVYPQKFMK